MIGKSSLAFVLFLPVAALAQADPLFDPQTGYRIADYRAPVPETAPGARTADTAKARDLHRAGALFVDVFPLKSYDILPGGAFAPVPAHDTIPGAAWLPLVGPGRIDARAQAYLETALARLTRGDRARDIVVFCRTDCWMSWNASQRIARLGYTAVHWYPEGADGWALAGQPLARATPHPLP